MQISSAVWKYTAPRLTWTYLVEKLKFDKAIRGAYIPTELDSSLHQVPERKFNSNENNLVRQV